MLLLVLMVALVPSAAVSAQNRAAKPSDIEWEALRPGLLATYRSLIDPGATLIRMDAKPAFSLGHSSAHPRLPPGPFEVIWSGVLWVRDPGPISFDAYLCGELLLEVDGVPVLRGHGARATAQIHSKEGLDRAPGLYRLTIRYRSLDGLPARLQIGWQAATLARQPVPAWHFKHLPAELSRAATEEQRAAQGRTEVGRLGCARCHQSAFPGVTDPPPGPSLGGIEGRLQRAWLLDWLADPGKIRPGARMPALFPSGRKGFVERWLVAEHLLGPLPATPLAAPATGDHREGRIGFILFGCSACHQLPDIPPTEQLDLDRFPLVGLKDRMPEASLTAFLGNPRSRYPDGRMPRLPVPPDTARDIAAYLLLWSKPAVTGAPGRPPTPEEIKNVARGLGVNGPTGVATALIRTKGCAQCHPGLGQSTPLDIPLTPGDESRGCLLGKTTPHFSVDPQVRQAIAAYRTVAVRDKYPAPFEARQRLLERSGCVRCHQRDSDRPPPIEQVGSTLGGSGLEPVPYQRTPRLEHPHQEYTEAYLLSAVREGVNPLRGPRYSYRMPAFGSDADTLVQALAEGDGDVPAPPEGVAKSSNDPTLGPLVGSALAGFQGYACISCHVWRGRSLADPDPGAVGPDLTRVAGRIRREWFDSFLEDPSRLHPGTPMPSIFPKGKRASLASVLEGDPVKQAEALWRYFALGKDAPNPKSPPPLPVAAPGSEGPPIVAQIPIHLADHGLIETICVLNGTHDLVVYDLAGPALHSVYTGAELVREVQGRLRKFMIAGKPAGDGLRSDPVLELLGKGHAESMTTPVFHGYDRLSDGVRVRWLARFVSTHLEVQETLRIVSGKDKRRLVRELHVSDVPIGRTLVWRSWLPASMVTEVTPGIGTAKSTRAGKLLTIVLSPTGNPGAVTVAINYDLPPTQTPPAYARTVLPDPGTPEAGSLERPGYRAIAFPRPKTISGEDRIMPVALAADPRTGRLFVASWKTGEIFALTDPNRDGKSARFENYTDGLFEDAFGMLAEEDALYVLHRRNLTRIVDTDGDGIADRFDRVAALTQGVADTYDYAYGLVRDKTSAFILSYAQYADAHMPGAGSALRLLPGRKPQEVAFGFRNPLGWCTGPEGEVFFTDNQGEWVATNKLCHLEEGRFYGFPNPDQPQHTSKLRGRTAVWIPYDWARSINGVAYDNTGGKFGPFSGQFFLAELMFGGGIIRAQLEKVNGAYQGACFPFWGKGLLGPLSLAFDRRGRLFVGSITEPGWMAQPDRGAVFGIDFTGQMPFEMQSVQVRPHGFRITFTAPVAPDTARDPASYHLEHYRYEYTGEYGSPELDRTRVAIERLEVAPNRRSVDLTTAPLVKDRVYLIKPQGVRSASGEPLVNPAAAYTLNEIPAEKP
jgi:cytochrome c551/c552